MRLDSVDPQFSTEQAGYQAAVLSRLVAEVYTIEIIEPLAKRAEADLKRLGYLNVKSARWRWLQGVAGVRAVQLHHCDLCSRSSTPAVDRSVGRRWADDHPGR